MSPSYLALASSVHSYSYLSSVRSLATFAESPSYPSSASSSSSFSRVSCAGESPVSGDLNFVLHRALDSSGVATVHAREARQGFLKQIQNLTSVERETSIAINRRVDLATAALFIAAEDDALLSHSSVPLPVDAFVDRLYDLVISYMRSYSSSLKSSPEKFLKCIETFMYVDKAFHRTDVDPSDLRPLYLHSVLTHRMGSAVMLSLIYTEILKTLRSWSLLDFDVEIYFPHDRLSVPRGYHKQKSKESDQSHIITVQGFLEESLFLRAAEAATYDSPSNSTAESGSQLAAAKAARHRLQRGVWTNIRFGDMRCALSACERLILLETDPKELRDYSVLLYHCGFYKESLQYLQLYRESEDVTKTAEKEAEDNLMVRLKLISMEDGWSSASSYRNNSLSDNSEPW
ncbi:PREDICTED: uncharacterized protein LOC104826727 isoform X2 [Tarenaya hassleriana]|uniref:uncharacterized protein LOC104826727 isoform X2 n=1 Tax=Tarenaya hassleriana TaxID=28532 RepID=UPI00053CA3A1|nr:PREDICTED: uncharacterized protein LOC104826727 isoform X2 [Tarenaya hassleriana]